MNGGTSNALKGIEPLVSSSVTNPRIFNAPLRFGSALQVTTRHFVWERPMSAATRLPVRRQTSACPIPAVSVC